eukprot:gene12636-13933_t
METEVNARKYRDVKILLVYISRYKKTFRFCLDDTVWTAKQAVLLEFSTMNLVDPLNYGFYMPPFKGKTGKFLDEERLLKDYPAEGYGDHLETYQKKFLEHLMIGNLERAKQLLEKGLDPNFQDEKTGETPLTIMAMVGNSKEACMLLVNYGAYLDYRSADGMTALHKAVIKNRQECITCLLDLGASPNLKDAKGFTPLYRGLLNGANADCCELLLNERATIGVTDHQGSQEIHQACHNGYEQHLDHLIFYGASINSRTKTGNTPLHICAIENQEYCARLLLSRGAEKSLLNQSNQSAYEIALLTGHNDVAEVIKNFDENGIELFNHKPIYSRRRKREIQDANESGKNQNPDLLRSNTLPTKIDHNSNQDEMFLKSVRKVSKSHVNETHEAVRRVSTEEHAADSGSECSDSDEETNKQNKLDKRRFTSSVVTSKKTPAPIKSVEGANLKHRLYQSTPGRQFLAIVDYQPRAPGELLMEKGDVVELLYVGEQGFWEGRIKDKTGWFHSSCVEEMKKTNKKAKNKTWFGKKSGQKEMLHYKVQTTEARKDGSLPRMVQLKRGNKGFGFQLRGANSHMVRIEFTPSKQFPALQYIGEVDEGEAADNAGLKPGDFILEVNGEDVINATHGHVVSLVANSGKSLSLKVVTIVTVDGLNSSTLVHESPTNKAAHSSGDEATINKQFNSSSSSSSTSLNAARPQYSSLTMGPLHKSATFDNHNDSPTNVATVITLDKKVQRKRSVKSMWSDNALKLSQPDEVITEEISKGVIRRQQTVSMNIADELNYSDTDSGFYIRSTSISSRSSSCGDVIDGRKISATLPRRFSRTNSQGSEDSDSRPRQPPNYEDTLENMRRIGRKPSIKCGEKETVNQSQTGAKSSVENNSENDAVLIPAVPSYAPPAPPERNQTPKAPIRSMSVPNNPPPASEPSVRLDRRSLGSYNALSSDEDEPSSDFAKNLLQVVNARENRMIHKKCSIDDVINLRKKEQNLDVIKENEEAKRHVSKISRPSNSDVTSPNHVKVPDSSVLYTASSTSSLDTQYSKDSGIDVTEIIAQSPGEQPPDLASALANAVARRAEKMIDINAVIEQSRQQRITNQNQTLSAAKMKTPPSTVTQVDNHTRVLNQLLTLQCNENTSSSEASKTPPPATKPKPKPKQQQHKSKIDAKQEEESFTNLPSPLPEAAPLPTPSAFGNRDSIELGILTPPPMFVASPAKNDNHDDINVNDLPAPPSDYVSISTSSVNERQAQQEFRTMADSMSSVEPPPPYSPPRAKADLPASLSEKSVMEWTAEDVGIWLDFINMGQYKDTFIENDIQGMHLSELSKEELSELGVKKLGHRLTLDDCISKLARNKQFSEV